MKYYKFSDYEKRTNQLINIIGLKTEHKPIKRTGYKTKGTNRKSLNFKYSKWNRKINKGSVKTWK